MKTYHVEVAVDGDRWISRGHLKGKKLEAVLKRAYNDEFPRNYLDPSRIRGNVVYHRKYRDLPVLRVTEVLEA